MPLCCPRKMLSLHILLISRCPPYPLYLGDRLIVWHLIRELTQQGFTFDLIALTQRPDDASEQHHYAHLFRSITLIPETPRTLAQYLYRMLNPLARFPRMAAQAWSGALWQSVTDHLRTHRYEGVHVFGGVQVYEIAQALGSHPAIITPYESFALYMARQRQQAPTLMNRVQEGAARAYERWMYQPYKQVVVLAEPDAQALRQLSPGLPLTVIPNGIDLDYFTGERPAVVPNSLLYVGNYEYPPNVEAALLLIDRIFPQVRAAIPEATVSIVGNAPPPELIARAGPGVVITGRIPEVRDAYAQAAVFAAPLITGAGIKNKVLEALAMRVPVVGTPLSVDGIHVRDGDSALVAPVETMAEAIIRLLRDEALRQQLGEQGRAVIEQGYSWGFVASRYAEIYQRLFQR